VERGILYYGGTGCTYKAYPFSLSYLHFSLSLLTFFACMRYCLLLPAYPCLLPSTCCMRAARALRVIPRCFTFNGIAPDFRYAKILLQPVLWST